MDVSEQKKNIQKILKKIHPGKLKELFRIGRGRNLAKFITELIPVLRGWVNYFRLVEVKCVFEELDGWIRRKLRCILWRQWKRSLTRAKNLMR